MDNEYRSYSSTSYIKPDDRESKYKYQATEPSKGKPPRFIAGETLEHSAHTSLFQFLFSVDSVLKSLMEREFPASSFLEKLKQLALSFNYSNDAAAILNLSSLLPYMSASLKSLKTSPAEIFLFLIEEFMTLRGFAEHRKPDSFFTLSNEDSPFIVASSLSLRESDSWKSAIEDAIGKRMMPAAFVVEMKWENEPNSEEIARNFKGMPQITQGRDEFEVSSWIGFNGHFYNPACLYSDKWTLYEEFGTNDNLSWLQLAWVAVSRNIRPVMLFFRQKREYKPTSQYIASTDFDKLLRFAQKKDEINRSYEQNFQKREEIERTPEQYYQKREEINKESYQKREEAARPANPLFQKREELNRTADPYYQKKEDYIPYTQEIPPKRDELNKSAEIISQKREEYNLPYKQYTPNRLEQSKVPEYYSTRPSESYKKYDYPPEPKRDEYSRQPDSFRKEPPQDYTAQPESYRQENKYPKSMSIDQSRDRQKIFEKNISTLESPRLSYQESPRSYNQESSPKREAAESTWTCKKCSKEGNSDTFECAGCRTINWDKFYEIKSKAAPKPTSPQKTEDKGRYTIRDKKDDLLSQSQFESRENLYNKPAFPTNENSFSRTFYGDVRENMYSTDSFDRKYNKEELRNKQDVDLRASFQRKSDNTSYNRNASPKSLSALLEGGDPNPDTEYRGRERYKEDQDSSRKRNMSSNGFEDRLSYTSIIKKPESSYNTSTARDEDIYSSRDAGKMRGVSSAAKISTERVKNTETLDRSYGRTVTFGPDPDRPVLKDSVSSKDLAKEYSYKPSELRSKPMEKNDAKWSCQECRTQNSSMFYLCSNCRKPRPKEFDFPSQKSEESLNRWTCIGCKSTNSMYSESCWKCKRPQLKQNLGNEIKVQEDYVEEPRYTFPERGREFNYQSKLR
ncbi:unnamed protein product [Blepharisma stoltei]|uniref:RanBP2-type domain-containing protein n=1 Tax=Blepharisma stoltei TaxID=1481888 RepID=A0AAU9JZV6_9CILI|nr:unnamed protein product [Blepharisma stoltei]